MFWESGGGAYINLYETRDAHVVGAVAAKLIEITTIVPKEKVVLTVFGSKHDEPEVIFRQIVIK